MSPNKTRGVFYGIARLPGDSQAVSKGRIGRRVAGKGTGRLMCRIFK